MNIDPDNSYFSQNKKFLKSIFAKYNQRDFMWFCNENQIELVEEDNWRMILKSWKSHEILDLFLNKIKKNNCELKTNSEVSEIKNISTQSNSTYFEIKLTNKEKYKTKNVIISSGWKSFFQIWTSWDGYNFAKTFWINITPTLPWLCGISTKKNLSPLSWISTKAEINLINKTTKNQKSKLSTTKTDKLHIYSLLTKLTNYIQSKCRHLRILMNPRQKHKYRKIFEKQFSSWNKTWTKQSSKKVINND